MDVQITPVGAGSSRLHLPTDEICAVWNAAFGPEFRLTERLWMQNTVGDPSFLPSDLLVAFDEGGATTGFALTKRFREAKLYPNLNLEKYENIGYIAALAVRPSQQHQGLGRQLLAAAEAKLQAEGANQVWVGANFRHFFPGLPLGYPVAQHLFETVGYTFDQSRPEHDLDGTLSPEIFEPVLASITGLTYRQGQPSDWKHLLAFVEQNFPGRWYYDLGLYLEEGGFLEDITLLLDQQQAVQGFLMAYSAQSRVLGPSIYWLTGQTEWGGIGPLGLSPAMRGKGGGLGLVAAGMRYLYNKGVRQTRIDWTTLTDFYGRLGFKPALTYWRGRKVL